MNNSLNVFMQAQDIVCCSGRQIQGYILLIQEGTI